MDDRSPQAASANRRAPELNRVSASGVETGFPAVPSGEVVKSRRTPRLVRSNFVGDHWREGGTQLFLQPVTTSGKIKSKVHLVNLFASLSFFFYRLVSAERPARVQDGSFGYGSQKQKRTKPRPFILSWLNSRDNAVSFLADHIDCRSMFCSPHTPECSREASNYVKKSTWAFIFIGTLVA